VINASRLFSATTGEGEASPLSHVLPADARRYVRASEERYDVIVSDNFHPARSGSGALYTVEHFTAVRERLKTSGLFCQWLPLHQLDLATLRSIIRSFLSVYPDGMAMLANNSLDTPVLGLVGRASGGSFDAERVRDRLADQALSRIAARVGIDDEFAVLGSFVAGPAALTHFAGDAPANTDDRPFVAYQAPRITYAPNSQPRDRLIELLREMPSTPVEAVAATSDLSWSRRLSAYWTARNRFIEVGHDVRPSTDAQQMLAQVQDPLLEVLNISPDFRPAYDPLLALGKALAQSDEIAARALLQALVKVQPDRPEASVALREIDEAKH